MKPNTLRHIFNVWPPFLLSGIHVTELAPDWSFARTRIALLRVYADQVLARAPGWSAATTAGAVDLIAIAQVERHEDFADVIADRLNKVQGVTDTETHIAFRTYSADDEAQAFAIGLDG